MSDNTAPLDRRPRQGRCSVCGTVGITLNRAHIVPISRGGSQGPENLIYLCPNCHAQMDRGELREFEFQAVLAQLMRASGLFDKATIGEEATLHDGARILRADIVAMEAKSGRRLLIECKGLSALSQRRMDELAVDLNQYRAFDPAATVVVALPARLSDRERAMLTKLGFEVWDLDGIVERFHTQLDEVSHPVLRPLLLGVAALHEKGIPGTPEGRLIAELVATPTGQSSWAAYQRLIARIFERLFVPPLSPPLTEKRDAIGQNRRDIILPNYAESGFWAFLRSRYAAEFIVADAKNYADDVGKDEALQMLNYLKADGAGLFGLLVTRKGAAEACRHALKEHWTRHGKLVVCIADEEIERMLRLKEGGGPPETVIRQCIEDFRLSV